MIELPASIGYVHVYEAVDQAGRALYGAGWASTQDQDELKKRVYSKCVVVESVITKLAEACEAGDLASACKESSAYIHHLGPEIWRAPHWRSYFATGTIDTDLPRLRDGKRTGETVRCERVPIYVRKDSLAEFIKSHEPTPAAARRYPGDARLIEEGRRMVANGMEKRAVARKLAEQAEGASFDAKVDRLRRAL